MSKFIKTAADEWYRNFLGERLLTAWHSYNDHFFNGQLFVPYVLLAEPSYPSALADCAQRSGWGGTTQIKIRPRLLTGQHPAVMPGDEFAEGRLRFVFDILLHEMVHQWQIEVDGNLEKSFRGHGPRFASRCNEIGEKLGLSPVRSKARSESEKSIPNSGQWPHCVRPPEYYLGAVRETYLRPSERGGELSISDDAPDEEESTTFASLHVLTSAAIGYRAAMLRGRGIREAKSVLLKAALNYRNRTASERAEMGRGEREVIAA